MYKISLLETNASLIKEIGEAQKFLVSNNTNRMFTDLLLKGSCESPFRTDIYHVAYILSSCDVNEELDISVID